MKGSEVGYLLICSFLKETHPETTQAPGVKSFVSTHSTHTPRSHARMHASPIYLQPLDSESIFIY